MSNPNNLDVLDKEWTKLAPHLLDYNYTMPLNQQTAINDMIKNKYFGSSKIREQRKEFVELLGDRHFNLPIARAAKLHAANSKSPVYATQFSFVPNKGCAHFFMGDENIYKGASHADDLIHVLRDAPIPVDDDETSMLMSKKLIDLWMIFIEGKPFPKKWETVKDNLPAYSYLDLKSPSEEDSFVKVNDYGKESFWSMIKFAEDYGFLEPIHEEL